MPDRASPWEASGAAKTGDAFSDRCGHLIIRMDGPGGLPALLRMVRAESPRSWRCQSSSFRPVRGTCPCRLAGDRPPFSGRLMRQTGSRGFSADRAALFRRSTAGLVSCLVRKRLEGSRFMPFPPQRIGHCARPSGTDFVVRISLASLVIARGAATCLIGRFAPGRWRQFDSRAARLRQTDCNRLLRRAGAMLALANVLDFFAHELAGRCRRRAPLTQVTSRFRCS